MQSLSAQHDRTPGAGCVGCGVDLLMMCTACGSAAVSAEQWLASWQLTGAVPASICSWHPSQQMWDGHTAPLIIALLAC